MTILNANTNHPEWLSILKVIIIIFTGFCISIFSGLLGIGGGALLVPTLVFMLGMSQHKAHGTSLAVMSPIVLLTAIYYAGHGYVNWLIAIELAVGGIIGAGIGARICATLSASKLRKIFGAFLIIVGVRMLYDLIPALTSGAQPVELGLIISPSSIWGILVITSIGIITGVLSGLLGVGGGIIMIPAMVLLLGVSQKLAQGISLAVIIPVSISGGLIHYKHGNVDAKVGIWLAVGGVAGALMGANLAMSIDSLILRGAFGVLMLTMGTWSIIRRTAHD